MIKKIILSVLLIVIILHLIGYYVALKSKKSDSFFCNFDVVYWYGYNNVIRKPEQLTSDTLCELTAVEMQRDKVEQIFNDLKFKCFTESLVVVNVGPYDLLVFSNQKGEKIGVRISEMYGTFRILGEPGRYMLSENSKKILEKEIERMESILKDEKKDGILK